MDFIDISWPISHATTSYKDRHPVRFEHLKQFESDGVRETIIHMYSHTGTHIDAPSHFIQDGSTIDQIPAHTFIGPCTVVDMTAVAHCITRTDLEPLAINAGDIILLKTTNSALAPTARFTQDFIYLEQSGAAYLAQQKNQGCWHRLSRHRTEST